MQNDYCRILKVHNLGRKSNSIVLKTHFVVNSIILRAGIIIVVSNFYMMESYGKFPFC